MNSHESLGRQYANEHGYKPLALAKFDENDFYRGAEAFGLVPSAWMWSNEIYANEPWQLPLPLILEIETERQTSPHTGRDHISAIFSSERQAYVAIWNAVLQTKEAK